METEKHKCAAVAAYTGKPCSQRGTHLVGGKWFCTKHARVEKRGGAKPPKAKRQKLTDEHVKMLTGAAAPLPKNVSAVAMRLRKLLDRYKIEYVTVQRGSDRVKFARYQESEATL
jgi:hypothetical protein